MQAIKQCKLALPWSMFCFFSAALDTAELFPLFLRKLSLGSSFRKATGHTSIKATLRRFLIGIDRERNNALPPKMAAYRP
jgi:hypothetical protein